MKTKCDWHLKQNVEDLNLENKSKIFHDLFCHNHKLSHHTWGQLEIHTYKGTNLQRNQGQENIDFIRTWTRHLFFSKESPSCLNITIKTKSIIWRFQNKVSLLQIILDNHWCGNLKLLEHRTKIGIFWKITLLYLFICKVRKQLHQGNVSVVTIPVQKRQYHPSTR